MSRDNRAGREPRRRDAGQLRPRREPDHPRGDLRGARHRLARPRRAGPGRRGRVRRRAQGRGHEGAQDRRRRHRPDRRSGRASDRACRSRRKVVRHRPRRGHAARASAPPRCTSAGPRASVGIADGAGACRDFEPKEYLSVKEARRLDRFSQLARGRRRRGASSRPAGTASSPYDPMRVGCVIATGIGGIETVETQHDVMRDQGPKMVSPLGIPPVHAQRRPRPRCR